MISCDIIIPIKDNLGDTAGCLDWLARHTEPGYRLILVDDASGDETAAWLRQAASDSRFGPTLLLRNQTNLGWTGATNRGLAASQAPYICLMNNDTLAAPGWLPALMDKLARVPRLGLVQPLGNERSIRREAEKDIVAYGRRVAERNRGRYRRLSYISGFCLLMPRRLYQELGPFDPVYPQGLWADHDYLRRAQGLGWLAGEAQDGLVYHLENRTLGAKGPQWKESARRGEKIFIARWGYKRRLLWSPPWPLDDPGPETGRQMEALYALADRGHDIYVALAHGERPERVLAAHGLPEHSNAYLRPCPLPWPLRRAWAWYLYRYLLHKKRVTFRAGGPASRLDFSALPPADIPDHEVGVLWRGK